MQQETVWYPSDEEGYAVGTLVGESSKGPDWVTVKTQKGTEVLVGFRQ